MTDDTSLPTLLDPGRVSTLEQLADIPEEEICCKSRRALAPGEPTGSTRSASCARWAPGRQEAAGHQDLIAMKAYDREKAASFFATY